jgi:hypothetical protein
VAECQLPKLKMGVRFPSPAPVFSFKILSLSSSPTSVAECVAGTIPIAGLPAQTFSDGRPPRQPNIAPIITIVPTAAKDAFKRKPHCWSTGKCYRAYPG